jgi:hypothetical protein
MDRWRKAIVSLVRADRGFPVITGEDAYVVGQVDLLDLYCGPNS